MDKKLKEVISKIKNLLDESDIAGTVVLYAPGRIESCVKIDTSFSCANTVGEEIKVKSKLNEFKDEKEYADIIYNTGKMFHYLALETAELAMSLIPITEMINGEHGLKYELLEGK